MHAAAAAARARPSVADALHLAGSDVSRAASLLWHLDANRLRAGASGEYELDLQARAGRRGTFLASPRRLFRALRDDAVFHRRTFARLAALFRLHDSRAVPRYASDEDLQFILAVADTPVMRFVRVWLVAQGHLPDTSPAEFVQLLVVMWFSPSEGRKRNSTGFQHVFCGDLKRGFLTGLHNFVRVFLEERAGNLQYMGYVDPAIVARKKGKRKPVAATPAAADAAAPVPHQPVLGIRFKLFGCRKHVSTMFFGVSPEYEIALYTLLSVCSVSDININLGRCRARIVVRMDKGKISVAYPILLKQRDDAPIVCLNSVGLVREPCSPPAFSGKRRRVVDVDEHRPRKNVRRRTDNSTGVESDPGVACIVDLTVAADEDARSKIFDTIDLEADDALVTVAPTQATAVIELD